MRWSYSSARLFRQCQRKWYFAKIVAGPGKLTDETRLRARRLSYLSTLSAWRGDIVDTVISERIVPALQMGDRVKSGDARIYARKMFDQQRAFAEDHRKEDLTLVKSHYPGEFALFHEHFYGPEPTEDDFDAAWHDVVTALSTLYSLNDFRAQLVEGMSFYAQPPLHFDIVADLQGKAVPDLLVYTDDAPIQIIDWKVHTDGTNDARGQLASYAIALSRMSKPNSNFPVDDWQAPAKDIVLKEVQLLLGDVRTHDLTDDDIEDAEAFMMRTAFSMEQLQDGKKFADCDIKEFEATSDPELCASCSFRSICWETPGHA